MMGLPQVAVGAVFAAMIAGAVSLLGLIISKEQKTSEFRQDWIDGLRCEIAALIAHANALHGSIGAKPGDWDSERDDFVGINIAAAQIRLRLNPSEDLSQKILDCIKEMENLLNPGRPIAFQALNAIEMRLVEYAQQLLKSEWKRVRSGEATFKAAKVVAAAIVVAIPILILLNYLWHSAIGMRLRP